MCHGTPPTARGTPWGARPKQLSTKRAIGPRSQPIGPRSQPPYDDTWQVPEEVAPEAAERARSGPASLSSEANRAAAEQWLQRARDCHEAGDDDAALRFCEKSLKLCELPSAQSLTQHIRKYGKGSPAAAAVARVRDASDQYAVLQLARGCTEAEAKRAYRKLSLTLHPDRNHAAGAEAAFKTLSEAYSDVLKELGADVNTPRE